MSLRYPMNHKIVLLDDKCMPERKTAGAVGWDLKIRKAIHLPPHFTMKVPTGIKVELLRGYEGHIRPRSGVFKKGVVIDGTIDDDYRGEVYVIMHNSSDQPVTFQQYERVAQMVINTYSDARFKLVTEGELTETDRGEGGFGHTGKF